MKNKILGLLIAAFATFSLSAQSPVDGVWNFSMSSPMGAVSAVVTMKTDAGVLTGEFDLGGGRTWIIENGTVDGSTIGFDINRDGSSMTYVMSAEVSGDSIDGAAAAMGTTADWSMERGN